MTRPEPHDPRTNEATSSGMASGGMTSDETAAYEANPNQVITAGSEPSAALRADVLADMLAELRDGLSRAQKEIPSRYFYDARGSELFEEITRLPEYYLTRAEREILEAQMPAWAARLRARSVV